MKLKRLPFIKKYGSTREALRDIAAVLWKHRREMLRACGIGLLVGIVAILSIPREYEASVQAVPERRSYVVQNALTDADDAETTVGGMQVTDALRPTLYPRIIHSKPFLYSMCDIPVEPVIDGEKQRMTLAEYMREHHRRPWWSALLMLPRQVAGLLLSPFTSSERGEGTLQLDSLASGGGQTNGLPSVFRLTRRQQLVMARIGRQLAVELDTKRGIITLVARMQDPGVAAAVADSLNSHLQAYVTNYRMRKEEQNLRYVEEIYGQVQEEYYRAQEEYARYVDTHRDLAGYNEERMELVRLRTDMQIAYRSYVKQSGQLQVARMRAYRQRPVYAVIKPAQVPMEPASPRKGLLLLGWTVLGAFACAAKIFFKRGLKAWQEEKRLSLKTE